MNVHYSTLTDADEHQTLGDHCYNVFHWVKEEKKKKTMIFVQYGVAKHRRGAVVATIVLKTRG